MEDRDIIRLFLERSEQAVHALKEKYHRLCCTIARSILSNEQDAQEAVNDAYLAVWNQIPPDQPASMTAYLTRIVRNTAYNRLDYNHAAKRDSRLEESLQELENILPGGQDPSHILESRQISQVIDRYLSSQSKTNRYIFVRRYYYLDTCSQIGAALHLHERAVAARLFRLRNGLRKELEKEGIQV